MFALIVFLNFGYEKIIQIGDENDFLRSPFNKESVQNGIPEFKLIFSGLC